MTTARAQFPGPVGYSPAARKDTVQRVTLHRRRTLHEPAADTTSAHQSRNTAHAPIGNTPTLPLALALATSLAVHLLILLSLPAHQENAAVETVRPIELVRLHSPEPVDTAHPRPSPLTPTRSAPAVRRLAQEPLPAKPIAANPATATSRHEPAPTTMKRNVPAPPTPRPNTPVSAHNAAPETNKLPAAPQQVISPTMADKPTTTSTMTTPRAAAHPQPVYQPVNIQAAYSDNPKPDYPAVARRRGWQGTVVLTLDVDAQGRPQRVTVTTTSGYSLLDQSARDAVRHWEFRPARRDGIAIIAENLRLPIRFQLSDSSTQTNTPRTDY